MCKTYTHKHTHMKGNKLNTCKYKKTPKVLVISHYVRGLKPDGTQGDKDSLCLKTEH